MLRFGIALLLTGCFANKAFRKDFTSLSQSPCVDGIILNVYESGCISTYVGRYVGDIPILKIRCTAAKKQSWMTRNAFYVVPQGVEFQEAHWQPYCSDVYANTYSSPVR